MDVQCRKHEKGTGDTDTFCLCSYGWFCKHSVTSSYLHVASASCYTVESVILPREAFNISLSVIASTYYGYFYLFNL